MSKISPELTVATVNVHFGDMIREDGGLDPLEQYKPDILLLQEVINPQNELEGQLSAANYQLTHTICEFGLAIALRIDSQLRLVDGSIRTLELGKMGPIEHTLAQKWARRPHSLTAHGMLAAQFETESNEILTVVNTRVTVSSNRSTRKRQIMAINKEFTDRYYDGAVILGGDMNHFPAPQAIDKVMRQRSALESVDLAGEPTWRAKRSPMYISAAFIRGQRVENMSAELDALLYRPENLESTSVSVVDTISDHRTIVGSFRFKNRS